MSIPVALLLGAIQGLTEFLPVSSSGHLAITQQFIPGFSQPGVLFDIVVHLGTLVAVIAYFRREIRLLFQGLGFNVEASEGRRLIALLVVGTLPAVVAALTVGDWVEQSFESLLAIGAALCVTGILLLVTPRLRVGDRDLKGVRFSDAALIGLFQSVALFPGISRSGSTIVMGLARGLSREGAARFSFLLSIPAILGATVFNIRDAIGLPAEHRLAYLVAFLTAFGVGYFAIHLVLRLLAGQKFHWFGYYCLLLGGCLLVYVNTRTA